MQGSCSDLLKRHISLHTATDQSGEKRKIRASHACVACAAIKVKCDQQKPCKRCLSKRIECRVEATESQHDQDTTTADERESSIAHGKDVTELIGTPIPVQQELSISKHESPSLTSFLRDVLCSSITTNSDHILESSLDWDHHMAFRDLMDFGQDMTLDFNNLDTILADDWRLNWLNPSLGTQIPDQQREQSASSSNAPTIDESINLSTAAYSRSAWRWNPNHEKVDQDHALASVLLHGHGPDKLPRPRQQPLTQPLNQQVLPPYQQLYRPNISRIAIGSLHYC